MRWGRRMHNYLKILVQCYVERGMEFVCLILERRFNDKNI